MESKSSKYDGIAVALAWPETFCKQANAWYDKPMRWLGFNKDYYYQAGHAAVLLIQKGGEKCHYFDFGRYHAPFGKGRVRNDETDPELEVFSKPHFSFDGKEVVNIREILFELQSKVSYHGDGRLYASQFQIHFVKALQKALELQAREFISYGPFVKNGSNCSRFVCSVIAAGSPPVINLLKLKLLVPTTPTTMSNIKAGKYFESIPKLSTIGATIEVVRPNYRDWADDLSWLSTTFLQPERHNNIPEDAQWLSGEGYGSWYSVTAKDKLILLSKFSPKGTKEHTTIFNVDSLSVDFSKPFNIVYPTNNLVLSISQQGQTFSFNQGKDVNMNYGKVSVG